MTMTLEEYKAAYSGDDEAAPGWAAIDAVLAKLYPNIEPVHFGTAIPYLLGGEDPLTGISYYPSQSGGQAHHHFVSYGFSELFYDEESVGSDYSKFGFELSFRLKPFPEDEGRHISWPAAMMQNLARYVFNSQNVFDDNHWITANGPIRLNTETEMCGAVFFTDPELGSIDTVHGKVQFLQIIGIMKVELDAIMAKQITAEEVINRLRTIDPFMVTDLERKVSVL